MTLMQSGELFAGVGGLGMAVDEVFCAEPAWFCEFDTAPSKVLAHHRPDVPNFGDVTKVDWKSAPPVRVLAGGFPCQDVSLAGRRRGMGEGTRSGLWSEFAKAIDTLRPDWVVIENVRGLLSADAGGGTRIERDCSVCGWTDGRGRVHRDSRSTQSGGRADVLRRPDHAGDDGTSTASPDGVSGFVGRITDAEQGRDGSLGGGMGMDASGAGGRSGAAAADAVSADQATAGGTGGGARGVQGVPADKGERVADLDTRGREGVRGDEGGDPPAEREGAACPDCGGELSERVVSNMEPCPLCVGDDPRHVLRALGAVLGDLAELGFDAEWTGIRASDVGAPHGRFRVFILAWPRERTIADDNGDGLGGIGRGGGFVERDTDGRAGERQTTGSLKLLSTPDTVPEAPNTGSNSHKAGNVVGLGNQVMSLLPTPGAYDGDRGGSQHPDKRRDGGHSVTLQDVAEHALLGTPRTAQGIMNDLRDPNVIGNPRGRLEDQIALMPTPRASRGGSATETMYDLGAERVDDERPQGQVVADVTDWGPYEAAIRRWETIIGRPAPAPVRFDGKGGKPRLNPELTEWMMGWPVGHVTDPAIGLSRAEQLKACGKGVVPRQAAAALREMLARPGVPPITREAIA